ncbi:fimbrial protein [Pseudomonas sp. SDO528_S397]
MKRPISALAMLLMIVPAARAADGEITVTGAINGTTCSISGGTGPGPGPGADANFPVLLATVQASALKSAGQTAGSTPFFIHVGGAAGTCPDGTVVAVLYESNSPAINPATGNLVNRAPATPAPAENVEVEIADGVTHQRIDLRAGVNSSSATVTGGTATLPFSAHYIATGVATAGPVSTSVLYSVTFP